MLYIIGKNCSKQIVDENIRSKITNFLEENIRVNIYDLGLDEVILGMTKSQTHKKKINNY